MQSLSEQAPPYRSVDVSPILNAHLAAVHLGCVLTSGWRQPEKTNLHVSPWQECAALCVRCIVGYSNTVRYFKAHVHRRGHAPLRKVYKWEIPWIRRDEEAQVMHAGILESLLDVILEYKSFGGVGNLPLVPGTHMTGHRILREQKIRCLVAG